MATGYLRTLIVMLVVVVYGASPIFCCCTPLANATPLPNGSHASMVMSASTESHASHEKAHQHTQGRDDDAACEHCGDQLYIATNTNTLNIPPLSEPVSIKIPLDIKQTAISIYAVIAPNALTALRWQDLLTHTPITLKIRNQT